MKPTSSLFFGIPGSPARARRTLWSSVGLLYLIPVGVDVAHETAGRRAAGFVALAAFAAFYLGTVVSHRSWLDPVSPVTWTLFGGMAALTAVLPFAFGTSWLGLPVYLSLSSVITLPQRVAAVGPVAAAALCAVQCEALGAGTAATAITGGTTISLGLLMGAFRHSRTLVHELQEARGEVARLAAADERLQIARDLHDLLGQSLSLIVLKSELAQRDPARTRTEVDEIRSVARQALADVRGTISGYRARCLTDEIGSARAVLDAAGIALTVRTPAALPPPAVGALLGWALREAVTNVARHSGAARCAITVACDDRNATLTVEDDGRAAADPAPGNGLTGLAERVAEAGGTVVSGVRPEGGFRIAVTVPLTTTARAPEPADSTPGTSPAPH